MYIYVYLTLREKIHLPRAIRNAAYSQYSRFPTSPPGLLLFPAHPPTRGNPPTFGPSKSDTRELNIRNLTEEPRS